jgi:hypothetical protein
MAKAIPFFVSLPFFFKRITPQPIEEKLLYSIEGKAYDHCVIGGISMACRSNCAFSGNAPIGRQIEELFVTGGVFAISAVAVNALVLYVAGIEDVTPGVINGSMTALAASGTHRMRHYLADGRVNEKWSAEDRIVNMTALILTSVGSTVLLLKFSGYPVKKWEVLKMETLSILAMAGTTKFILNDGSR